MTAYRAIVGFVALVTALLLQATLVGPLAVSLGDSWPVSLVLVLVLCTAVSTGPGAGIGFGFGAGLLADLASAHPAGLLALIWMVAGLVAGCLGGFTSGSSRAVSSGRRRRIGQVVAARRDQCLLVGAVGAVTTVVATVVEAVLVRPHDPVAPALARALLAGTGDAGLALLVLPLVSAALHTAALRSHTSVRPLPFGAPRLPFTALDASEPVS